jgi:hypothetical protein
VRVTLRVLVVAVVGTIATAVVWPEGAERVARVAFLAVGAAIVTDLVLRWQQSYASSASAPFAPALRREVQPWRPQGLTDLQRDLRLMAIPNAGRRLPRTTRLRDTCRAAAQERLDELDLDLDRPDDRAAIDDTLGADVTAFLLGEVRTVPVDDLLAAVEPPRAGDRSVR